MKKECRLRYLIYVFLCFPNEIREGGKLSLATQKLVKSGSHHKNTALIKKISLFDTALVMTYT